jgi:hypothetical protein
MAYKGADQFQGLVGPLVAALRDRHELAAGVRPVAALIGCQRLPPAPDRTGAGRAGTAPQADHRGCRPAADEAPAGQAPEGPWHGAGGPISGGGGPGAVEGGAGGEGTPEVHGRGGASNG